MEHILKSTIRWVGVNLQKPKSTFGTFSKKKVVLGVFFQISKSTFGTFLIKKGNFRLIFGKFNKLSIVCQTYLVIFTAR